MAKLPTRESLGGLPGVQGGGIARVSVPSFAGAGSGIADVGAGLAQAAKAIGDHARQSDEFDAERRFQEFDWNQRLNLDKSMREIQPGQASTFATGWQENYTKAAKDFLAGVPDHLKPKYDQKLFGSERDMFGAATTFQRTEQKRFATNSYSDAVENVYRPRARTATTDELGGVIADNDALIDAMPGLTPIERDELRRKGHRAIGLSHLDALPPEQVKALANSRTGQSVVDRIVQVESGGRSNVKNPNSSATGAGQFIDSTWLTMVSRYRPDLAQGKTRQEVLALRSDPQLSREMVDKYAQENGAVLRNAGINPTAGNVYLAHFLGPQGATKVLTANPNTPVEQILPAPVINANRSILAGKSAGEVAGWSERKMAGATPALSALSDEDWQRAESAAQTRQTRAGAQVGETFERHLIDAASGRSALPDRASIELDTNLTEQQRNLLLSKYDTVAKDVVGTQRFIDRLNSEGASFNPYDPKEKQYADAAYTRMGADPTALQVITAKTGIIPKSAATQMRADINSSDPNRVVAGLTLATNLLATNGNIFAAVEGENEFEKNAVKFRHYVDTVGMTAQQAAQQIIKERDPEYKAKINARIKSEDVDAKIKKELSVNDIAGQFDEIPWVPFTNPNVGFDPGTRAVMFSIYAEEVKRHYLETGDWAQAKVLAANDLKKTWGVTRVGGSATVVPYPAEKAPAYAGIEGVDERIARQAIEAIEQDRDIKIDRSALRLTPIPGRTAQAYKAGLPPPYMVSWLDKDGVLHSLNPGQAFVADPQRMRDEQDLARRTSLERRAARQQPILDFKVERRARASQSQRLLRSSHPSVAKDGEARLPLDADDEGPAGDRIPVNASPNMSEMMPPNIRVAQATQIPWEQLSPAEQNVLQNSARQLTDGPELDKFDEALAQYKTIKLPAGRGNDDPRKYLSAPHNQLPPEVERYDLPDGSVILTLPRLLVS
jgi:hypothetical protein